MSRNKINTNNQSNSKITPEQSSQVQTIVICVDDYWIRFGNPRQSSSFIGDLIGKYLFFCKNQETLIKLCEYEIIKHNFEIAKVSTNANNGEYVCCLYWADDKRKYELANRYKYREDIKYRYWKSNADTRAGKYSKQYLQSV